MFDFITDLVRDINRGSGTEVKWETQQQAEYRIYKENCIRIAKAQTLVDQETDPVRKQQMQTLLYMGITDFSSLDK